MADTITTRYKETGLDEQEKNLKSLEKQAKKTDGTIEKGQKNVVEGQKKIAKGQNSLISGFKKLGGVLAAAFATVQISAFVTEAINLAAAAEPIERAFKRLDNPLLLAQLRKAVKGTVSDVELMKQAVKASNFKLDLTQLADLFEFAKIRANETGESVDFLVDSIVVGIGRKSPLILDNLGISAIALKDKLNGVSVAAASIGEVTEAVGAIAREELEKMGKVSETTADKIDALNAQWDNMQIAIGKRLIPVVDFLIDKFQEWIDLLADPEAELQAERFDKFRASLKGLSDERVEITIGLITAKLIDQREQFGRLERRLATFTELQIIASDALTKEKEILEDLNKDIKENAELLEIAERALKDYGKGTDDDTKKTIDFKKALRDLEIQLERIRDAGRAAKLDFAAGVEEAIDLTEKQASVAAGLAEEGRTQAQKDADEADRISDKQNIKFFEDIEKKKLAQEKLALEQIGQQQDILNNAIAIAGQIDNINQIVSNNKIANLQAELETGKISEEAFLEEKKRIEQESFRVSKAISIATAVVNTAVAVTKALGTAPPLNIPLAISTGLLGAAEIAAISAQQPPQFAKGTESAPGGLALVGEKGPEFTYLPKGAQVFSNQKTMENEGIFAAIHRNKLEPFIHEKYILPYLVKQQGNVAENMVASMGINGIDYTPLFKKGMRNDDKNTATLTKALSKSRDEAYFNNRYRS